MILEKCPRCGEQHIDLPVYGFLAPPRVQGIVFGAWTICPSRIEPILLMDAGSDPVAAGKLRDKLTQEGSYLTACRRSLDTKPIPEPEQAETV